MYKDAWFMTVDSLGAIRFDRETHRGMLRFNTPLSGEFRCGFDTSSSPRDDDNGPSLSEPPPASRRRTEENLEERLGNGARSGG